MEDFAVVTDAERLSRIGQLDALIIQKRGLLDTLRDVKAEISRLQTSLYAGYAPPRLPRGFWRDMLMQILNEQELGGDGGRFYSAQEIRELLNTRCDFDRRCVALTFRLHNALSNLARKGLFEVDKSMGKYRYRLARIDNGVNNVS